MIITLDQITIYFLVLSRLSGMMIQAPFFSNKMMFTFGKMAFVIWLGTLLIFVVPFTPTPPATPIAFIAAMLVELLIGIIMGFVADVIISGVELAGALMDTQAGLSVASLLDPSTGRNAALFEQLLKRVVILIFIIIDGHHMILSALYQSYMLLPVGSPIDLNKGLPFVFGLGRDIFAIGVQLSAPILLIIFLIDFSFGILNRIAEQINVFQLGFQIKPLAGILVFLSFTPGLVQAIQIIIEAILGNLIQVMVLLRG